MASSPFAITTAIAQGALHRPPGEIENIGSTPGPDKNVSEGINKQVFYMEKMYIRMESIIANKK